MLAAIGGVSVGTERVFDLLEFEKPLIVRREPERTLSAGPDGQIVAIPTWLPQREAPGERAQHKQRCRSAQRELPNQERDPRWVIALSIAGRVLALGSLVFRMPKRSLLEGWGRFSTQRGWPQSQTWPGEKRCRHPKKIAIANHYCAIRSASLKSAELACSSGRWAKDFQPHFWEVIRWDIDAGQ